MLFFKKSFFAFGFPLLKLAFSLLGFKEGADIGHHIVNDNLKDVLRNVALGAALFLSDFYGSFLLIFHHV